MSSTFNDVLTSYGSFLSSLNNATYSTSNISNATYDLAAAKTNLASLNTNLTNTITDQKAILTQQENTKFILDRELGRLNQKKGDMDSIIAQQKRLDELNFSANERYRDWINIIIWAIFFVVIIAALFAISAMFPIIPDSLLTLLVTIVAAGGFMFVSYKIYLFYQRDNLNHAKLNQSMMYNPNSVDMSKNSVDKTDYSNPNDLINMTGVCVGSTCCAKGTTYDSSYGYCKVETFVGARDGAPASAADAAPYSQAPSKFVSFAPYP